MLEPNQMFCKDFKHLIKRSHQVVCKHLKHSHQVVCSDGSGCFPSLLLGLAIPGLAEIPR